MTARTIPATLAGLVLAALLAAVSHAAAAPTASPRFEVRGANTLPSLAEIGRTASPLNAIVTKSDTFLVSSHGSTTSRASARPAAGPARTAPARSTRTSSPTRP
jgi:hypothetical protein